MTPLRWVVVIGLVGLFVFAKVWVMRHPKGVAAIVIGAALLIISEPAQAA